MLTELHAGAVRLLREAERQGSPQAASVHARGLRRFAASVGDALEDLARCGIEPPNEIDVPDPLSGLAG